MPSYSGALKKFRDSGYPKDSVADTGDESGGEPSVRVIKLTDEEAKALAQYGQPGEEVECTVSGKVDGNTFRVMSVQSSGENPNVNADAEEVMSKMRPGGMVQSQTIPSPS